MSAGLTNTVSHRFIIFTTFTHNVKIAASLFFLWEFIQVQRSYNRLFFESWRRSMSELLFSGLIHLNQQSFNQKGGKGRW